MRPSLITALALASVVALLVVPTWAGPPKLPQSPDVMDPLPFSHGEHERPLARVGLGCTDCHGFRGEGDLAPARSVCHGCHVDPEVRLARGPSACGACHPTRSQLEPVNHGVGWEEAHAQPAKAPQATCSDCHERSVCVDCHASRGALARSPHPPAFRSTHGVEARLDPASCDTCHAAARCADCHESGGAPW